MAGPDYDIDDDVFEGIQKVFSSLNKLDEVVIFGSRAKGNAKPGSDIDLALFGENISASDLLSFYEQLDNLNLPYRFDLIIYDQIEKEAVREHIDRVGKQIYKK
jgi:uncharacterized protein